LTVIDGHNLYFALDRVDDDDFEGGLEKLIDDLRVLLRRGRHLLVLDGTGGRDSRGHEKNLNEHLRLIYSGASMSADDWIQRWSTRMALPNWELVTADVRLYERIRTKGLKRLDPVTWYRGVSRKSNTAQNHSSPRSRRENFLQGGKKNFGSTDEWLDYFGES
jgi:hypothetical protein